MKRFLVFLVFCGAFASVYPSCTFFKVTDKSILQGGEEIRTVLKAEGESVSKVYALNSFSAIDCGTVCDIVYTQGPDKVELKAPENILEKIVVDVDESGVLSVNFVEGFRYSDNHKKTKITLIVSSPVLEDVIIRGAADFKVPEGIKGGSFSLEVRGAGDVDIAGLDVSKADFIIKGAGDIDVEDLSCEEFDLDISGAGDCEISGTAEKGSIKVSGAGDVDVTELKVGSLQSEVHGVGTIHRPNKE